jgi:hypothetical protein
MNENTRTIVVRTNIIEVDSILPIGLWSLAYNVEEDEQDRETENRNVPIVVVLNVGYLNDAPC